jgi:diamine N-acetyltransferase
LIRRRISTLDACPLNVTHTSGIPPTSLTPVTFVRVRASEAAQLSELATELFDATYGPLCRAADVDAYMAESLTPSTLLRELTDPRSWVFAAVVNNEWIGYTHVRLAALPEDVTSQQAAGVGTTPMEVARFYVSRKWQGTGVAKAMLTTVVQHAQTQGSPSLWLSVWQENPRAIAFYQKSGFESIGTGKFLMGEELQDDFIMERAVDKLPEQSAE